MKTETKFNVNDIIQHKYDCGFEDGKKCMEVIEIVTQTCSAGTQIFYYVRHLMAVKRETGYGADKKIQWEIAHGTNKDQTDNGLKKYREDEVTECEKETYDIITGIIK